MRLAGHKLPIKTKFVRREGRGAAVMKSSEAHNLKDDELVERIRQTREEQFRACASSTPPGSWRTPRGSTTCVVTFARLLTVAKEAGNRSRARAEGLMPDEEKNEEQQEETPEAPAEGAAGPRRLRPRRPLPRSRLPRRLPPRRPACRGGG